MHNDAEASFCSKSFFFPLRSVDYMFVLEYKLITILGIMNLLCGRKEGGSAIRSSIITRV